MANYTEREAKYTEREVVLLSKEQADTVKRLAGKRPEFCAIDGRASKAAVIRHGLEFFLSHESNLLDEVLGENGE